MDYMSEELWGAGGVLAGIALTTAGNWWLERAKHLRERKRAKNEKGLKVCREILDIIDLDIAQIEDHWENTGEPLDLPFETRAYDLLTDVHVTCPPKVHRAAESLVEVFHEWAWRRANKETVMRRRHEFIELMRKL